MYYFFFFLSSSECDLLVPELQFRSVILAKFLRTLVQLPSFLICLNVKSFSSEVA